LFPSPLSEKLHNVELFMAHVLIFLFFLSPSGIPEKKFAVMCRKYHRVFRKTLSFVSLMKHITFIYKVKLISTGSKISRKDLKKKTGEREREREREEKSENENKKKFFK